MFNAIFGEIVGIPNTINYYKVNKNQRFVALHISLKMTVQTLFSLCFAKKFSPDTLNETKLLI